MQLTTTEYHALYSWIGRCLLLELDAASLQSLAAPATLATLRRLEPRLDAYLNQSWTKADFDDAASEYCALFVLPGGVTQQASHWIGGDTEEVGHGLVAGVRRVLDNFGLSTETLPMGNVPMDNVSLLVLLAAHLYEIDIAESSTHGHDFMLGFVAPWAPAFSAALLGRTHNPVYRVVGHLLSQLADPAAASPV